LKLLIDTHLLLWWLSGSKALSAPARKLIGDPANTVFVSAVSIWEIRLKQSLNKLRVPSDFERRVGAEPFESLPLTAAHADGVGNLPWHHRDPFDRMLVAQAKAEGLLLVTADSSLKAYGNFVLSVK
jgi:PIN domain nuclease of toxin-antitoxin system